MNRSQSPLAPRAKGAKPKKVTHFPGISEHRAEGKE